MQTTALKKATAILIGLVLLAPGISRAQDSTRIIVFPFENNDGSLVANEDVLSEFIQALTRIGKEVVPFTAYAGETEVDICRRLKCDNYYFGEIGESRGTYDIEIVKHSPDGSPFIAAELKVIGKNMIPLAMSKAAESLSWNQNLVLTVNQPVAKPRGRARGEVAPKPDAQIEVENALGPRANLTRQYRRFERGRDFGNISFAEHYYGLMLRQERKGKIIASVVTPIVAAVGFGFTGYLFYKGNREEEENPDTIMAGFGYYMLGSVMLVLSTGGTIASLVVGLVKMGRARKKLHKLEPLVDGIGSDTTFASYEKPRLDFGIMTATNGAPAGASFSISF